MSEGLPAARSQSVFLYALPELEDLWADPRLVDIAQQLLGSPASYFFESSLVRYDFRQGEIYDKRHLHHDAKGTPDNIYNRVNEALTETFPALRFGIYLQDTETLSGGLKVGVGTHKIDVSSFENRDLRLTNVKSQPGDVIVFTHRLLHSPLALRLKRDPEAALMPADEDSMFAAKPDDFIPMPDVREVLFIDYTSLDASADLYIKNRALHSGGQGQLAERLVDGGILDRNEDSPLCLRVDTAIVEAVDNVSKHAAEGGISGEGARHLMRLPRLCRAHFETSGFHPLLTSQVNDDTPETALRLYQEIAPRLAAMRKQTRTRRTDEHMGISPTALRRQQIENYDPARWPDFHRERRLRSPAKKVLHADTRIFTMGSCFAMQIRRAMRARGLDVYPNYAGVPYDQTREVFDMIPSREALQHYDTFTVRQEFEAAFGLWADRAAGYWPVRNAAVNNFLCSPEVYQDPYRKLVYATTRPELVNLADRITDSIRDGLEKCSIAVLTLGLTEVWRHNITGKHLCKPPGTGYGGGLGQATFRQSTFVENYENVRATLDLFFARYPEKHVIISVSPVALGETFSVYDVGTANTESKSILRAVAGQISREYENVIYFPSYEMATNLGRQVYDTDGRHILQSCADEIVDVFIQTMS